MSPRIFIKIIIASLLSSSAVLPEGVHSMIVPHAEPARIDEASVKKVITADPAGGLSLTEAFRQARELLAAGVPVKIQMNSGIYTDDLSSLTWEGTMADTLLVIDGGAGCTWTGADDIPLSQGERSGDLWIFPWTHTLGMYSPFWGAKDPIAHRSEIAFVNGQPLRPVLLERWKVTGMDDKFKGGPVGYQFVEALDPVSVLKPGQFGIVEASDRGPGKIYLKAPDGMTAEKISVSVRRNLLCLNRKNNVVLRGITFMGCANGQQSGSAPVIFSRKSYSAEDRSHDVLIERCRFIWNGGAGLDVAGSRWTIRDSVFSYNGYSGISTGYAEDLLLERCETSFNIWRGYLAGEPGWSYSGIKFHQTRRNTVLNHLSVGNWNNGLWWDIHCKDVFVSNCIMFENYSMGYEMELGAGPYIGDRLFSSGSGAHDRSNPCQLLLMNAGTVFIRNSVFRGDRFGGPNAKKQDCATVVRFSYTRNDPHSKMEVIPRGTYMLSNCIIYAGHNQRYAAQSENWNVPNDAMQPAGIDNIFFREGGTDAFRYHITAEHGYPNADLKEYSAAGNEKNARWEKVTFKDPLHGDFRFTAESIAGRESQFPQVMIPAEKISKLLWFRNWCGHVSVIGVNADKE